MTTTSNTSVRRLAAARLISITGGAAAFIALNFTVYEVTGSTLWLTAALVCTFGIQGIVGPFAGVLGDRFDRRRVMILSDLAGAAAYFAMATVTDDPVAMIAFALVAAVAELPFESASAAAIPNLAGEEHLARANSLVSIGRYAGIALGPALGGVLVDGFGPTWVFLGNGITFLVSAAIVWSIRARFATDRTQEEEPEAGIAAIRAGLLFLRHHPVLWRITSAWAVLVLGLGMSMVADAPFAGEFGREAGGYGFLIGAWGAGSVLGSFLGRFVRVANERLVIVTSTFGIAVTSALIGIAPAFWIALVFLLLNGVNDAIGLVSEQSLRQRSTPDALRSRVTAAAESVWQIAMLVSFLTADPLIRAVGARGVYVLGGAFGVIATLLLLPLLRGHRGRSDDPEPPLSDEVEMGPQAALTDQA
jgi:MFS family permease